MGSGPTPKQVEITCQVDERGFLYQIYGNFAFPSLRRIYVVGNFSRKIIRGLHRHNEEWKGYFVVRGAAKFVVVDEQKKTTSYVLSYRKPSVLIVPPKYSHGWVSLTDHTMIIGLSNKTLEESVKDDIREDPFVLGEELWNVKSR